MPSPYDSESFMTSLAAAQSDVAKHVQNALAEIARRQQMAQQQVGKAGAEQGRIFSGATQDYMGSLGQLQGNLGQYGGLFQNLSAYDPSSFQQAMGTLQQGFGQANVGLGQGFKEQGDVRTSRANVLSAELNRDIETQRAQYIAQREAEDRAREQARIQAEAARAFAISGAGGGYGGSGGYGGLGGGGGGGGGGGRTYASSVKPQEHQNARGLMPVPLPANAPYYPRPAVGPKRPF